ncbi:extracellular solute-binding protein [Paenibacillus sp. J5C_2022]|uniref:extracellular solute-binding protein n=1 Tax=Paenibacillus sp. J5C2022 TaxID=2977129 RepID=UPI0021D0B052|nr:extracellular solute-binding protein [Paenibacillus sp. J5C2022]MCU6710496.1 extracellular solute-binding protein [Paenibacillus sp. J5C2022]
MKHNYKRMFIGGMVLSMLLVSACSSNGSSNNDKSSGASTSPEGGQPAAQEKAKISIMANFSTANVAPADQAIFDQLEQDLNVELNWVIPPSTGYKEQLQLSLVSGDYPDLIFFPSESDESFINAVNDGVLIPINPYLDNLPNVKKYTYDISWKALETKRDGNYYAVPRTSVARNDGFIVREDWLNNIGFEMPANHEVTVDQFTDILRQFTFNDPDKNGKNDTYGYAAYLNTAKMIDPLLSNQFGDLGWQKANAGPYQYITPMYDQNSDTYKKVLAYTQQLFKEGLVDPDSAVIDRNASVDRFKLGISGVRTEFAGNAYTAELTGKENDPNTEITYLFVQNEQGDLKGAAYGTATFGVWGVTEKAKNPERTLQVLDWLLSDKGWDLVKYGVEGVEYTMVDGNRQYNPDVTAPWRRAIVRRANDGDFFIDTKLPNDIRSGLKTFVDKAIDTVEFSLDQGFIPPAAKQPSFMDFKLIWDETITKIMVGDLPVDAFDNLLTQWYEKGGKAYVEQMNEYISSTQ